MIGCYGVVLAITSPNLCKNVTDSLPDIIAMIYLSVISENMHSGNKSSVLVLVTEKKKKNAIALAIPDPNLVKYFKDSPPDIIKCNN